MEKGEHVDAGILGRRSNPRGPRRDEPDRLFDRVIAQARSIGSGAGVVGQQASRADAAMMIVPGVIAFVDDQAGGAVTQMVNMFRTVFRA